MCSYFPLGKLAVLVSLRNEKPWTGFVMSGTSLLTGTKTTIKDVLWDSWCLSTSNSLSHPCLSPSPARESFGFHLHPHVMADSALIKSVMLLEAKRKKGTMCGLTGVWVFIIHEGVMPKRCSFPDFSCVEWTLNMKPILLICRHIVAVPHKWMFDTTANHGKKWGRG